MRRRHPRRAYASLAGLVLTLAGLISAGTQAAHAPATDGGHPTVSGGTVTVGILAPRGTAHARDQWRATLDALDAAIPRASFEARPMTLDGIADAVSAGRIDFVLTNPGQFVLLGTPYGLSWLATLRSRPGGSAREALGSVLWVREASTYTRAAQLAGERVVAVHERAFGGYLLILPRLGDIGVDIDALDPAFLGYPVDALAYQLRDGQAEAAIMPACMLEQMAAEGLVVREDYRALATTESLGQCAASTRAYPDWTFAALPHVDEALTGDVARTLLSMDGADTARWGAPVSAAEVATLFGNLDLHPLRDPLPARVMEMLMQYWHYSLLAASLVLAGIAHHAWVQHQARRHGRALEATQLALRAREKELADAQSLNVSGELAAILAHELNQPLAAIRHYAEGGQLRLRRERPDSPILEPLARISREADRGAGIIEQARQWIRRDAEPLDDILIDALIEDARAMAEPRLNGLGVTLDAKVSATLTARGNRLALEQVLGNLINNSLDAFEALGRAGWITIEAYPATEAATTVIVVRDNAGGFSPERLEKPFMPLDSNRAHGMGLGLVITRRLMQRQHGDIRIANHEQGGALVRLSLPDGTPAGATS